MIHTIALGICLQVGNPVSEVVDRKARFVSVQAVVKLPILSGHERSELQLIADTVADEVDGYSRADMRDLAARAGLSLRVTLMPDHVRIQFGALPDEVKPAIGYVDQILRNATFPVDSLNRAMGEIPFRKRSLWATGLQPYKVEFTRVRREEVLDLYHRVFRPENVWLSVGGRFDPAEIEDYWDRKNEDWKPGKPPRASLDQTPLTPVLSLPGLESLYELRGKEFAGNDPSISVKLLSIIALGSGKGSAMFEQLREANGLSYRLEGLLWPTATGFAPRLIMSSGDKTPPLDLLKSMRQHLVDAVNAWTDDDLNRARGMAEGILTRGIEMSPLYFTAASPVFDTLDDQTFMAGYWRMKTGNEWNPRQLVGQMALASLSDLKETALDMLNGASSGFILGTG